MIDSPFVALLVLAVIIAVPLVLRHFRAATPQGIRVVARTAIARNAIIAVVVVDGRTLLIGTGDNGVQLLTELNSNAHVAQPTSMDAGHHTVLNADLATDAATTGHAQLNTSTGPRIGPLDRLRALTVRATPRAGRPIRVPHRR